MSDFDLGTKNLRLERDGPILWCTIDRPHARNALTPSMYFGIKKAVHLVNADKDLRALILTGTGDVFAPGGDLGGRAGRLDRRALGQAQVDPELVAVRGREELLAQVAEGHEAQQREHQRQRDPPANRLLPGEFLRL